MKASGRSRPFGFCFSSGARREIKWLEQICVRMKAASHSVRLLVNGQDVLNGKECRDPDQKVQQEIKESLKASFGGDPRIEDIDPCTREKSKTRGC